MTEKKYLSKALVLGRISLVRSLGREGIDITLAREDSLVFERSSRYTKEFVRLPNLLTGQAEALEILEQYGMNQKHKLVAFFNGESDVMLFSENRERLSKYFHIILADHKLISGLVDKGKFGLLAAKYDLPVPQTITPLNFSDCLEAAKTIGYPCILKPITQRRWHEPEIFNALGSRKAILVENEKRLIEILEMLPPVSGHEMIQQYIPGYDQNHYDFHAYIDKNKNVRGMVVGHKIRINPVHFGQGCYTHYIHEPHVIDTCLDALTKIGYIGAANINIKRHAVTGKNYILEINPRFSLWTIFDAACGVNQPLLQYLDALDLEPPSLRPTGKPVRWLFLGADFKAMKAYRRHGELTFYGWLKSFFSYKGKIEFHVFAWDDPLPLADCWAIKFYVFGRRVISFIMHGLWKRIRP